MEFISAFAQHVGFWQDILTVYDETIKQLAKDRKYVEIMADCENSVNEVEEVAENHLLLAKNVMRPELELKLRVRM